MTITATLATIVTATLTAAGTQGFYDALPMTDDGNVFLDTFALRDLFADLIADVPHSRAAIDALAVKWNGAFEMTDINGNSMSIAYCAAAAELLIEARDAHDIDQAEALGAGDWRAA